MISDHLGLIYDMIFCLDDTGRLTTAERKRLLSLTTQLSNALDKAERGLLPERGLLR